MIVSKKYRLAIAGTQPIVPIQLITASMLSLCACFSAWAMPATQYSVSNDELYSVLTGNRTMQGKAAAIGADSQHVGAGVAGLVADASEIQQNDITAQDLSFESAALPRDCNGNFDRIGFTGRKFSIVCNRHSAYGTNIAEVSESGTSVPFTDLFRSAEPFDILKDDDPYNMYQPREAIYNSQTGKWDGDYKFDNAGWPVYIAPGFKAASLVATMTPQGGALPDGWYDVLSDGNSGELEYHPQYGVDVQRNANNDRIRFHRRPEDTDNQDRLIIKIKPDLSRTNDPSGNVNIKNVRVIMPGGICKSNPLLHVAGNGNCRAGEFMPYREYHRTALRFNPAFLNYVKDFKVLRFLDMMEINSSPIRGWNHQARLTDATWNSECSNLLKPCEGETGRHGVPVEIMVDLANTVNAEPWFLIPHQAQDGYIRRFANTVNQNLRPNLKVHIEYSNETWNTDAKFEQGGYMIEKGCQRWPVLCPSNIEKAGMQFHVDKSKQLNQIWQRVFGDRLVRVLARHFRRPERSWSALQYAGRGQFDTLAVAPYFDISEPFHRYAIDERHLFVEPQDVDSVFSRIVRDRHEWKPLVDQHVAAAERFGIPLTAYESGQHLSIYDLGGPSRDNLRLRFQKANRDPRMGDEYTVRDNYWRCKTDNGLNVVYTAPSSHVLGYGGNFWGVKEFILQGRRTAHKYNSIRSLIDMHPTNLPTRNCR